MNYYISDLHLFHEAVLRFDDRPFSNLEEMHAEMVKRWNHKVTNGDTVYILGDVSMRGKNEDLIALAAILKGKKVLIRGNHDDVSDLRYRQLFQEVCDYKEIRDSIAGKSYELVLCHYPIFSWKHMSRGTILLYGHTHVPAFEQKNENYYVNPGSVSIPKENSRHSYMHFENGVFTWTDVETGEVWCTERVEK